MSEEQKQETPEKSKAELFAENPDRFVDMETLVIATMQTEDGLSMYINGKMKRNDVVRAMAEIQIAIMRDVIYADAAKAQRIIKPQGSIIGAARNRLFKR